jgi:UTP--glucose-1-phosphate uridylyltransferase
MLTIVDAPIIFYVVEEALKAGIEDIVLIQGRGKTAIEDFFDVSFELESKLESENRLELLNLLKKIRDNVNIISVRQKNPLGLGHAVLCAEKIIGSEPFAVLLGDEIFQNDGQSANATAQLISVFNKYQESTIPLMTVDDDSVSKYGIAEVTEWKDSLFKVTNLIEKPAANETKSRWALPGRYVLNPQIFNLLKETKPGKNQEIQLTDAINQQAHKGTVIATQLQSNRFDAGDKLGYLIANIEIALKRPDLKKPLEDYIKKLLKRI